MIKKFQKWMLERNQTLAEGMWGVDLPMRGRKPSDGLIGKETPNSNMGKGSSTPLQGKMKKK